MREREALRLAKRFVREQYPEFLDCYIEVAIEHDGERRRCWSFGVHIDREDARWSPDSENRYTGYCHHGSLDGRPIATGLF